MKRRLLSCILALTVVGSAMLFGSAGPMKTTAAAGIEGAKPISEGVYTFSNGNYDLLNMNGSFVRHYAGVTQCTKYWRVNATSNSAPNTYYISEAGPDINAECITVDRTNNRLTLAPYVGSISSQTWVLEDGRLRTFRGTYWIGLASNELDIKIVTSKEEALVWSMNPVDTSIKPIQNAAVVDVTTNLNDGNGTGYGGLKMPGMETYKWTFNYVQDTGRYRIRAYELVGKYLIHKDGKLEWGSSKDTDGEWLIKYNGTGQYFITTADGRYRIYSTSSGYVLSETNGTFFYISFK